ncbi:hypothetical protein MZO42_07645 [Sphingomonas psychrotolerans]|uniref:Autotransporter domain-containing protein n=1 Tax=Sphingomonas psychrotolerans TaxID=1327635 RepID=A0ABU3N456_9SPHN|nr:hypothetical protein [Sphingomonas psychrotolerans]MDT8758567.1 hypothetical protein [Sphingomonas psychrotolerans]
MRKSSKARLFSTCLTGAVLAVAAPAWGQTSDAPTWKPRAEVDAQVGKDIGISTSLFAPVAQNDSGLVYVDGRIGYDQRFDRNGSATIGARARVGDDVAIGANVGADFYRSDIGSRDQAAISMGLEGFTSVFDVRVNYRLPLSKTRTIGYIDPAASATGALVLENNRLIERRSGFRLEAIPLQGFSGEAGVRLPVGGNASIRGSVGGFDYWDKDADQNYRGVRGGLELDVEDRDSGARFTFGGTVEHDNRYGTDARATVRLSIPFGGRAGDRGAVPTGLDRQMGDRVRRDYMARSGSRYTDLTTNRFAVDARTGNAFGGFYYASGAGTAGAAGTLASPTTIADAVSRAGANGVVVALGSGGNITTPGVTLATDQYLVGGASTVDVRMSNGSTVQYALGGTNGVVVGTNAAAAAVTLGQGAVVRDITVRSVGTGIAATGVGGFAIERTIVENTGGAGISLTNTLGAVSLTGLTVRGGGGAGLLINGGSSISVANSTISGGAGAVDINDGGANLTTSLSNLTLSATGGNVLDIDGSGAGTVTVTGMSGITIRGGNGETGGLSVRSATFDASTTTAGIQTVNAGRMEVGTTAARINGQGVFLTDVTGSLSFADLDIANSGATGLRVVNSKVNSFTLATLDGTIDTVGGTATDLDPLVINLNFASVSSVGASGPGVILDNVQGGGTGGNALTIGTLTISNSGGDGLVILNSTGLVRVNGGTITGAGGSSVRIGTQGVAGSGGSANLIFAGAITDPTGAAPIVAIFNAAGTINFTGPISGSGGILVQDTLAGSAISFGAITLTGTAGDAINLNGLAGSIRFNGLVTIANPGANGIVIGNVSGGVTFGDVDITGLGNFTGLDVRSAQGNILFNTLDITGTGSGTGIDLTGSLNGSNVMVLGGSVIQGVNVGVDLSRVSMTGQFRFGDGDAGTLGSRISAAVPIVIELMNDGHGSYNFADVVLQGDTTNLTGAGLTAYYAKVGATGAGTRNDPGSLAGADASTAQYIVLLNDPAGGQDVFDAASAGGAFDLAPGQSLVSFLNGDFVAASGGGLPANLIVSGLGPTGITNVYAGSGAAVLTTSTAGSATINLASNSTIEGLVVRNAGGDVGVAGSGVSNVRITGSDISGATGAIAISDGGATSSVQLTHLDLASAAGTTLALSGAGAGTLTVSGADVDIAATGGSAALSITDVTSGGIGFGTVSAGISASTAVTLQNVSGGGVAFGSIAVAGTSTGEGVAIGNGGSAIAIGSISVGGSDGNAVQLTDNSGAISIGGIDATVSGTNGNGLFVAGGGNIAIGTLTVHGGDVGFAIDHSLGAITVGSGAITGAAYGIGFDGVEAGSSVSIGALTVGGSVFDGIGLEGVDGSVTFGATSITGVGRTGILLGAGSAGTITFGDVDIGGLGAGTTGVFARDASGTIRFNTLDIAGSSTTGTRGIDLTGATFATNFTTTDSGSITGVGIGIDLTNAAITGSFRYGDGSNTDADGASSTISAVTPIVITGVNAGTGSYNFLDVVLAGDTSTLTTSATLYFVKAGATGVGTMADPGSLAGAEASAASTIILLNDPSGGQDVLDAASVGNSFDLDAGQALLSFLGGDTLLLPGGAPANVLLYGVPQGQIGNPYAGSGAPILTTSIAGASTVKLAGNNLLDGLVITSAAGGLGVQGSGVANVMLRNSSISGGAGAIEIKDGGLNASVALRNLTLWSSGGNVVTLDGTAGGVLAVTALDSLRITGGNGETGGLSATGVLFDADLATAGAQAVSGSLTIGAAGARVNGDGFSVDTSDGSLDLSSLTVFNTTGIGVGLTGSSALTVAVRGGAIDTSGGAALVAGDAALTLNFASITATGGGIFTLNTNAADPAQAVLHVGALDLTDGGMFLSGSGDYVIDNGSIADNAFIALYLSGAVDLDYAGDITSGTGAAATIVAAGHTGSASFRDGTIDVTDGDGFQFLDADGTYSFTGTTTLHGGDAGINIANGSSGNFFFGAGTSVTNGAVANFVLQNSDANVTYLGSLTQGLGTDNFVVSGQTGGVLDFSQAVISASAGSGVLFTDADGSTMLGDVQLSGGAGIAIIADSAGSVSFDNVDITGVGANQTAVDLTGALGNVTFQTLDIAGLSTVGSKGIDLSGSTSTANIIVSESSTISGVGIGVDLTNAAITGTFRYGDGSSTDADGAASTISAGVPIEIAGLNGAVGTYNFADVALIGDTSRLTTSATTYFVAEGAGGVGTMADPGSLAGAEASGAQFIILLNDPSGGQDVLDAVDAGGSFDLAAGQALLGFLNGDTLTLPGGGPTNLILFGITPGQIVNPFAASGAPVLTNSGAGNTLGLASNTLVDGVMVTASNGPGIYAIGAANVTIRNSVVSGNQGAIVLGDGAANASAWLSNLQLSAGGGAVLNLNGSGAGTLTITGLDDITIAGGNGETSGILANGVVFDADLSTAGYQAVTGTLRLGSAAARIGGVGVYLDQAEGATDLTVDIATDGGSSLYATGGVGGLRLGIAGGTIDTINATAVDYGLILQDLSASVTLGSLAYSGTGIGVWTQNVTGVGAGGSALDIASLTVADGSAGAIAMTGSAIGGFRFGAGSIIGTTTNPAAITLSNTGASSFTYAGAINYAGADAVLLVSGGHNGTVDFTGTIDATSGNGLVFDDADGTYNFTGTSALAAGIRIFNGSAGSFSFGAGTTITGATGIAVDLQDSTASLDYAGTINYGSAGLAAVNVVNHSAGTIRFTGLIDVTTGSGMNFDNADGTYQFSGTTSLDAGAAGIVIANGSAGAFTFGAGANVITGGGSALAVSNSTASVDYRGSAYAAGGDGISITDHSTGTIDFSAATLDLNGGTTLRFDNADGSYSFGSFATTGGSGIAILNGSAGSFTFGDVDIADLGAGQTAVDLTGATGNVTFQTLDITGTGGTGIDLSGSTTAANIIVNESSSITGVGVGVDLTNAAITGNFRYGDGSSTDADGAASAISAVTPIAIGGLNPGVGTYNFADVVLTGDTSGLQTNKTVFWVQAGATGAGTRGDPGSLAAAEASGADVIILLDAQIAGQDVIDGASAGGGLDLSANQSLLSFLNGDTLSVGGGAPANLLLFGLAGGTVTNPYAGSGAPLLTTTQAGSTTVNLASGAVIDGVEIGNLDWLGVYGAGVVGATIRNSVIHGGVTAIRIVDNGANASIALSNLTLSSDTGDVLALLRTGAGQLTVTQLANITIEGGNSGAGLSSFEANFDADLATAGIQTVTGTVTVGSAANRVGGAGLVIEEAKGALNLTANVYNGDGVGLFASGGAGGFTLTIADGTIDTGFVTATGSALYLADLLADIQLDSIAYAGPSTGVTALNVTGVGAGGRALDVDMLTVAAGADRGIFLDGTTSGNFSFGSASSITGTTMAGVQLANSGAGTFGYDGLITGVTTGALVSVSNGHAGSAIFTGTLDATGGTGLQFDNADGSYQFSGATVTLNGGDAGIDVINGSAGSFVFGGLMSITSPSGTAINIENSTASFTYFGNLAYATAGQAALRVFGHSGGTITFQPASGFNVTNGTGLQFSDADGTYNFIGPVTLNGGDAGIDIVNGSGGSFSFGGGTSITSPSGTGFNVQNSTANVTYSGNLTYATAGQAAVNLVNHSGGTITFQSGTLNVTNGNGLQFDNADGTYAFTGTTTLNGGDAGIDIVNGSGGSFSFGGGTSITSPSGTGFNLQNSTANVTYSGNLNYATAGQFAIQVAGHSGGTITFQTGTLNATNGSGVRFDNADGSYQFTGATALSGTSSGFDIANGSAGTFDFGSATSVNATVLGLRLSNSTANVTFAGTLTSSTGYAVSATGDQSALDISTATLNVTNFGLNFNDADGSYTFGSFALTNGAGIVVANGSAGTLTFGDVDISGIGLGQTAVNLIGALGDVTFNTLDIAGISATNSRGVDLTGNAGTGNIVVTNSSTISGVGVGVDLTNASRTGLFQYGDGESAIDVASTISATTPLVITGLNSGTGTYNFADVNLVGDTSALATSATVYYVLAGASGAGTLSDPGSLAAAEAATADFIILLNDPAGGQDVLDALGSNGNDSFVLDANQALRSFRDGNSIALPGGAPANVILTGVMTGQVTNPYAASALTATDRAPVLTTSGGANTVTLAGNSLVDGVFVQSVVGFAAIRGGGLTGVTVSNATISGPGTALRLIDDGVAATATLTNLSISASGADMAVELSGAGAGTLTLTGSGNSISHSGSGALLTVNDVLIGGGNLGFTTVASSATGGGVDLGTVGGPGTLSFDTITIAGATGDGVAAHNSSAVVSLGKVSVSGAAGTGVSLTSNSGAISIDTINISASATGLSASGLTGTLTVGDGTIDGATTGILIGAGNTAASSFGNIDITGLQAGARGVDARVSGAGNVTFATLDISGVSTTGTRGVDLTGNTGTGDIVVTDSSNITGLGVGVDLTNASRPGLFQYGDGENVVDVASTISATTPLVIAGLNAGTGTYNFADVNLVGDTSALSTSATVYYVLAGATGAGTLVDPGSLAGAEAATADFIILLNNPAGGQDLLDALGSNGDDSLLLDANQALRSFRDGNTIALPGGAPANVILTGVMTGQVTNPYAASALTATDRTPMLTTTGAAATLILANSSTVDGVFVQGVSGQSAVQGTGLSGVTLSNSTFSGAGMALRLSDGAAAASATLTNLTLSASGANTAVALSGAGAGSLTLSGSGNSVSHSGSGALLTINDVLIGGGNLGFTTVASSATGGGVDLGLIGGLGTLSFGSIDVAGATGNGVALHNSSAFVNLGDVTVSGAAGTAIALTSNSQAITIGSIDISASATGISASGLTSTLTVGDGTIDGATVAGILIGAGNTVLLDFGNIDITALQTGARGVDARATGGSNVVFATLDIAGASTTGTRGIDLTGNTGGGAFTVNESSSIVGVDIGVDLTNASRISSFRYGDGSNIDADLAASTINANTPIVIAGLNGGAGTYDFRDVTLVGDTSPLETSAFFVRQGATGVGSANNPGSLAAAAASGASYIVLLNNNFGGSPETITGPLTLADGQTLLAFRDVNSFNVGGGAPANVFLYNVTSGTITNPFSGSGAPILTSADATGTVQLGGNNTIDGAIIANTGTGAGVYASGAAGTFTIRNSTISGGSGAINLLSGAATLNLGLQNLTLGNGGGAAGPLLNLNGSGGAFTVTGMSGLTIDTSGGENGGLIFNTITFDSNLASAGIQAVNAGAFTIGTSGARVQGDGLSLTNVSGALTFTDIDIANNGGTGLLVANSKANNFLLTTLDGSVDTTNGTAVNLDPLTVNITLASLAASGGAYGLLLDQVEGSFTVNGAVNVANAGTAGVAIRNNASLTASFNGAVTVNNSVGTGLSLANNAGATIVFAGAGSGTDVTTTSGSGVVVSGGGTISFGGTGNSIQTATGQVLSLDGIVAGSGIAFASLTSTGAVGGTAINLNNLDGAAFAAGTVSIAGTSGATSDGIFIGGGSSATLSFGATTIAATGDEGIEISGGGNGAVSFSSVTIDNTTGDGVLIDSATGTVTISGGAIGATDDPSGNGVTVTGGSGNVTVDASITKTSGGTALAVANHSAGTLSFGGNIAASSLGLGVGIDTVTGGSVTVSGNLTLSGNQNLIQVSNSAAAITFSGASKSVTGIAVQALNLINNTGSTIAFTGGGLAIGGTASQALRASGGGTLTVTGSGNTINGPTALNLDSVTIGAGGLNFDSVATSARVSGITLINVGASGGGAINLATVNLQGITGSAIDVQGTLGAALNITDLDIGLNSTTAIGVDLNGATLAAGIAANDFDLTNAAAAGTSIAVDLRGTTGGQVVRLGDSSAGGAAASIAGVNTGVWLDAATNATFTYGDGESATDGTSTISAGTGINAAAAPVAGSYNFTDVTFASSPGLGFGVGRTWFVDSDGATGGGNGSGADGANPMTLAAAELALAATDVIVLVNNGSAISTAGSNADNTLNLLANTQVRGFGQGPLALALSVPATIQLSSSTINIADPTGNGAATLTSAAGANVITLGASGNRISGFILDGAPAGALRGIVDNGGATGTVVNFMTIRNFNAVGGYGVEITPSTNSTIDNVTFSGNTNDLFLNAAGSTISNVTATGATGASITLDNATGTTTLTNLNISGAATGLSFTNAAGTINATNVDVAGAATSALTVSGGTASFNFDAASSIVQAAGGLTLNFTGNHTTGTFAFAGLINATSGNGMQFSNADGTYNFTGTTTLNGGNAGIDIYNGATGTFAFGSGTNLTHNGAGNAFVLLSSANLTFDGTITDNDGVAVEIDAHDAGIATFNGAISSSIGNASTVISVINSNGGAINFNGQMAIASTGTVVSLSGNQGSTITFNAGGTGLDITGTTGTAMLVTGGGTVNVQGSNNSIATTSGTLLSVTDTGGTATAVDLSFALASNTSGTNGIFVQRTGAGTITGAVNIGGGAITATTRGVSLTGDALDFTYGGTLTTSGAASRSFEATSRTGGTATLSGNLTDTSLGISVASNTGGTINFTGQTISLNTVANNAVTLTNNNGTTINFASAGGGNGLDIVTTTGVAFSASGGGTVTVTGSGNSIQTGTGQILNLSGVSAGAGGINWGSLQSTGVVGTIAINFNNFDSTGGGAFSGGTTTIVGTGGGNDAIFIGNGSAANVTFGTTTIGTGANVVSGDGIEINGSGNGAVTFASVDIDNTTAHGISIVGAAGATGAIAINGGTIGAGGAGSITGDGVNVTGGSGSVTVAASIAKTNAGNVVEVSSHTGGTVTFSNNLSATGGAANGILLSNNSGGSISFSGATKTLNTGVNNAIQFDNNAATGAAVSFTGGNLDVDTTTGRGITATSTTAGAGSLTIQGANNTIASVGGIALNLVNTNIAAGGLNFLSVAANGGTRGIVLNNTGATAGLTITGTGTTDGSGGTIQNITQRGIELLNTAQVSIANLNLTNASTTGQAAGQDLDLTTANGAIYMSGVATAVFDNINITGTIADNGITGINVSNFQLNNSLISGAGDGANESGIEFINLSGTSSLTNTEIAFSHTNSLDIVNTDVSLNLTLNNVIFRDTQSSAIGEGGFQFRSFSNAAGTPTTNIDILDSDFLRIRTQAMQIFAVDDSVLSVDITNNVIDSGTGIGTGIDINGDDTATVRFNIIGNPTIRSSGGSAVNITSFINANVMGRVQNNTISNYNNQDTSVTGAYGSNVRMLAQENSHLTVAVTGNTLSQGPGNNSSAVDTVAREGSARLDLTLTGNTITQTDPATLAAINVQSGSSSSTAIETNQIYANIANNNLTVPGGVNLLRLRVSELDNTHDPRIFLQGFVDGGAGIEDDAVATWNANGNTPGATTANIAVSLSGTATGPSAGTAQTPTNPLP